MPPLPSADFDAYGLSLADLRRRRRRLLITFAVALGVSSVAAVLFIATIGANPITVIQAFGMALGIALIAVAVSSYSSLWLFEEPIRAALGGDKELERRVRMIVLRGDANDLTEEQQVQAEKWALLMSRYLPATLTQGLLMFGGLVLSQNATVFNADGFLFPFLPWFFGVLVLMMLGLIPFQLRRTRRARDFAAASTQADDRHHDLLSESTTASPVTDVSGGEPPTPTPMPGEPLR